VVQASMNYISQTSEKSVYYAYDPPPGTARQTGLIISADCSAGGKSRPQLQSSVGIVRYLGFLTVALIALKVMRHVNWSWWWIFSPIWITAALLILLLGLAATVGASRIKANVWDDNTRNPLTV
jgi:hypothetical protein